MTHINSHIGHQLNINYGSYKTMSDKILHTLEVLKTATMHEVAKHLEVELYRVSGRMGELVKSGKIEIIGSKKIGSYNYSIYKIVNINC